MSLESAFQYVFDVICKLHLENKNISVATVRNSMTTKAPLPVITKAIASFKENPEQYLSVYQPTEAPEEKTQVEVNVNPKPELEERVKQLEQQVAFLTEQLAKLTS
ncbi:hypothetical protein [Catenovulum maritimum]|uniref:Uncharacterized protein n=1 Tax=Catenovulum maritimum TaxID=1513271 RepID=A0A0J8GSA0_9ALTE|nr:hypothetical protein [Catenovulum maritimum]KMT65680.1 hypothetical protein XM47_08280 [Catenovulum maritimum]